MIKKNIFKSLIFISAFAFAIPQPPDLGIGSYILYEPNTKKVLLLGSNFDFLIFKIRSFILLKKLSNELFIDKKRFLTFFANKLSLFMIVGTTYNKIF